MNTLHQQAVTLSKNYLGSEKALLSVLIEMDEKKAFLGLGYTGIFNYCLHALKFSESQAGYFSSVARKSREVPELKKAIDSNEISVSQARRIVSVITPATQGEWIGKAAELSQKQLEKEVAAVRPSSVRDRVRPVSAERHELRASISERVKLKLDRAKDLLKQQALEDVLEAALDALLDKKDPIKKAERTFLRKVKAGSAKIRHDVNLRDRGRCQVPGCSNTRYVELHHKKPRSRGGADSLDNLITLCSAHHRMWHTRGTAKPYMQGLSATAGPS